MNTYMETIKGLLAKGPDDLIDFLDSVYEYCEKRENINQQQIDQYLQELDEQTGDLPFARSNAISCTCFALCAEYEYAAFTDGFQKGAWLILNLLQEN